MENHFKNIHPLIFPLLPPFASALCTDIHRHSVTELNLTVFDNISFGNWTENDNTICLLLENPHFPSTETHNHFPTHEIVGKNCLENIRNGNWKSDKCMFHFIFVWWKWKITIPTGHYMPKRDFTHMIGYSRFTVWRILFDWKCAGAWAAATCSRHPSLACLFIYLEPLNKSFEHNNFSVQQEWKFAHNS